MVKSPITSLEGAYCLRGKNAIVTGGNRGIGLGIATAFAQQGANVAIMCRDRATAEAVVQDFSGKYEGKFAFYPLDIRDMANCRSAVAACVADFGGVDILVNNAGVAVAGPVLDMDEEMSDWFRCIDVDLNGAMRMCYVVGKYMRDAGKAALNHLTRDLAVEWGQYGINVNAIAPGYTYSDLMKNMPEDAARELLEKIPMGRFGQAIEIGALAVYLASEASNIVTGVIVTADGGYSLAV